MFELLKSFVVSLGSGLMCNMMLLDSHPLHWHPQLAKFSIITDNYNLVLSYHLKKPKPNKNEKNKMCTGSFSYVNFQENKFLATFYITFSFS